MPLVVVNPSMLTTQRAMKAAIQCFQRWEEAMNISHAHVDLDDAHVAMSGLPGEHQGSNFTFQHRVLLIHIGKAGGATVNRMLSDVMLM